MAVMALAVGGRLVGLLESHQADGVLAVAYVLLGASSSLDGDEVLVAIDAGLFAWCAFRWWKGGGGDDTKRRMRSAWKPFQPVRRTAPQGAS
jgi:hypothetical protein